MVGDRSALLSGGSVDGWSRAIAAVYRDAIGCYGDGVRRVAPVTVATFEGAYRHMHEIGDRFDLLVVDEVHHFGGGLRDESLEMTVADGGGSWRS